MPTETFANLPAEKQRRIFNAAVIEFAAKRFSEASINQIIKAGVISRGSFYQYFKDKEDLYLYVLTEIAKEKMVIAKQTEALNPDLGFFEVYRQMMSTLFQWAKEHPLYNQIGLLMTMDESQFITKLRERIPDGYAQLRELIERDQNRGLIKPEVDAALVVEMIVALMMYVMKEYYTTGSAPEIVQQKMMVVTQILKEGIARV